MQNHTGSYMIMKGYTQSCWILHNHTGFHQITHYQYHVWFFKFMLDDSGECRVMQECRSQLDYTVTQWPRYKVWFLVCLIKSQFQKYIFSILWAKFGSPVESQRARSYTTSRRTRSRSSRSRTSPSSSPSPRTTPSKASSMTTGTIVLLLLITVVEL